MIPKKIHYCWFGGKELPRSVQKCIASWNKYLPDYEIIQWNEENFNIDEIANSYVREAYEAKKYAFVSDFARLYALYNEGGFYFDTDLEVIKEFPQEFLEKDAVFGLEFENYIATSLMGAAKGSDIIKAFIKQYDNRKFKKEDGTYDMTPNPSILTEILYEYGFEPKNEKQELEVCTIYPITYFSPINPYRKGKALYSNNTYAIHHFEGSWGDKTKFEKVLNKIFGKKFSLKIRSGIKKIKAKVLK